MIKGITIVGSSSAGQKNGISVFELREVFSTLWVEFGSFGSDIPDQGRFNGWCEANQFFFSSVAAFVGDICLVGIFCLAESACCHGKDLAEPSPGLAEDHEDQTVSLRGGMARHPVEIGVHALLDLLGGQGAIRLPELSS